jgi:hypothetical protein
MIYVTGKFHAVLQHDFVPAEDIFLVLPEICSLGVQAMSMQHRSKFACSLDACPMCRNGFSLFGIYEMGIVGSKGV